MGTGVTGIILAGGKSSRMGQDKSLMPYDGMPLVQHVARRLAPVVDNLLLSTNTPERYDFLDIQTVADRVLDQGPLMAIASALAVSTTDLNIVVPCDMPELDVTLIEELIGALGEADIAVPVTEGHGFEPLCAVYRKRLVPTIDQLLDAGERKVATLYAHCATKEFPIAAGRLKNVNTKHDYDAMVKKED
jgi:molybdenum cofactor guanylyltransferase